MKRVWDEIKVLEDFPDSSCGAIAKCSCNLLKIILEADQHMKLIQFISGLNEEYDMSSQNLLSSDPLPTVNRAFHILQQVERQNLNNSKTDKVDMSALLASQVTGHTSSGGQKFSSKRDFKRMKSNRLCDHCKMRGHTRGAYRASRARIVLGSARARLTFHGFGSARELTELGGVELGSSS